MTNLPKHLFISDTDGGLYDTRQSEWAAAPVRKRYAGCRPRVESLQDVKAALRAGEFAFPGGYQLFFITRDGGVLSFDAARAEFANVAWDFMHDASTGWRVDAVGCAADLEEPVYCDHTGAEIS